MVYVSRLSQWIEKRWNAKGGNVVTDIDQTAAVLLPWQVGVEDRYLQGWNRFAVVAVCTGVAANFSRVRIRNPVGSNVMLVLEQLCVFGSTADNPWVIWGATVNDLTNLVTLTFTRIDPRGNPQPTAIVSQIAGPSAGPPLLQRSLTSSNGVVDFINNPDQQLNILPGQGTDIQGNVANQNLNVGLMWRERALELSELT